METRLRIIGTYTMLVVMLHTNSVSRVEIGEIIVRRSRQRNLVARVCASLFFFFPRVSFLIYYVTTENILRSGGEGIFLSN